MLATIPATLLSAIPVMEGYLALVMTGLLVVSLGAYVLAIMIGFCSPRVMVQMMAMRHPEAVQQVVSSIVMLFTAFAQISLIILMAIVWIMYQALLPWELLLCSVLSGFSWPGWWRPQLMALGRWLNVLCAILISSHLLWRPMGASVAGSHLWRDIHIVLATLGQGTAIIAVICAALIVFKQRGLKAKTMAGLTTEPPMDTLRRLFDLSSFSGLLCFSLAITSGLIFMGIQETPQPSFNRVKLIWALSIWSYYVYLIHLKVDAGVALIRRTKHALWGLSGFLTAYMLIAGLL